MFSLIPITQRQCLFSKKRTKTSRQVIKLNLFVRSLEKKRRLEKNRICLTFRSGTKIILNTNKSWLGCFFKFVFETHQPFLLLCPTPGTQQPTYLTTKSNLLATSSTLEFKRKITKNYDMIFKLAAIVCILQQISMVLSYPNHAQCELKW